jgi:hypothetical protein
VAAVLGVVVGLVLPLTAAPTGVAGTGSAVARPTGSAAAADVAPSARVDGAPLAAWTGGGLVSGTPTTYRAASDNFAQVGGCTFYASNSAAGAWCSAGGYHGTPQSLQAYLHGREFHYCRYFDIPNGFYLNAPPRPGGEYMLKGCFRDVDFTRPWGGQDVEIDIMSTFVEDGTDITLPAYMDRFWDHQADTNFYPVPRISIAPTFPARVGTYTFFHTYWFEALDNSERVQPRLNIPYNTLTEGTAHLRAEIDRVTIRPEPGEDEIDCGRAEIPFDPDADDAIPESEGGDQESDCWTVYDHSSADREKGTVSLRATAYWRVWVERQDGSTVPLGTYHFEASQRLPVAEVQTIVDW